MKTLIVILTTLITIPAMAGSRQHIRSDASIKAELRINCQQSTRIRTYISYNFDWPAAERCLTASWEQYKQDRTDRQQAQLMEELIEEQRYRNRHKQYRD